MELNSALSLLQRLPAPTGFERLPAVRPEAVEDRRLARTDSAANSQRTPSSEALSRADHRAKFVDRLDSMTRMLDQVKAAAAESESATTLVVEREGAETRSLAYSIFQGESGASVEQFVFTVSFKSEDGFTKTPPAPRAELLASLNEEAQQSTAQTQEAVLDPVQPPAPPVTAPVSKPVSEPVETPQAEPTTVQNDQPVSDETASLPEQSVSFDERVRQLIEFYRIDSPQAETAETSPLSTTEGPEESAAGEAATTNDALEEFIAIASERVRDIALGSDNDELFIDATVANRILTGKGDDVLDIKAAEATRIDAAKGDDVIYIDAEQTARIRAGSGDDILTVLADIASRIKGNLGDDDIFIEANEATRIRGGAGDDTITIDTAFAQRISGGEGDDAITVSADDVDRVYGGVGDDTIEIDAVNISRVGAGDGDDTLILRADTVDRVNAGAGDDTIVLDAKDAAIRFGAGGGEDIIEIETVGSLAVDIENDLASEFEEIDVTSEGGQITLSFASGEKLTINNTQNADFIAVRVGGDTVELQLSEPPETLDVVV